MIDQERAFEKLSKLKVGALFMKQGTGKTKVALDLMAFKRHKVDRLIWICPCSLKTEFEKQRQLWQPDLDIEVIGCESISQSDRVYLELLRTVQNSKCFITVDESLKIKNHTAKRTERIIEVGRYAEYKLVLNGTPMSKSVLDVYTQMNFLSPKILNMNFHDFREQYCEYFLRGKRKGQVCRSVNIAHLISIIDPYIFDADLDIKPGKTYEDVYYDIADRDEYDRMKAEYLNSHFDRGELFFYQISTICQRYYCDVSRRKDLLDTVILANKPCIVFVKYLSSIPEGAVCITGDTKDRESIIQAFRDGNTDVLYMTYGVGAFGLNLQFCHSMIFADHSFDYAQREQAEARIYRSGQMENCHYVNLRCRCGLEEMMFKSLDKKQSLLTTMKDAIMESKTGWEDFIRGI